MATPDPTVPAVLPAPMPELVWRATPEMAIAHAFSTSGPGWMTSRCLDRVRFSFRMQRVADDFPRCRACRHAVAGVAPETPLEVAAGWGQ